MMTVRAMVNLDRTQLSLRKGRKPGVSDGVDVLCPNAVARLEFRRSIERTVVRSTAVQHRPKLLCVFAWFFGFLGMRRRLGVCLLLHSTVQFRSRHDTFFVEQLLIGIKPFFVVAGAEVNFWRHVLYGGCLCAV